MRRRRILGLALLLPALSAAALGGCARTCPCAEPGGPGPPVRAGALDAAGAAALASGAVPSPPAPAPAPVGERAVSLRPGRTLTANGARIWYDVLGEGQGAPLVVINGGPGFDHRYLLTTDVWERLARGRRVVVYDQRGTGRSEPFRADGSQTVDHHVADLEALRVALGAPQVDLAGHSWGGYLGLAYATRYPERVAHLVLCDSGAPRFADTKIMLHEYFPDEMDRFEAHVSALLDGGAPSEGQAALRDLVTTMFYSADKRDAFVRRNEGLTLDFAMNQALEVATENIDLGPAVRALRMPTLVLNGRYDANVAPETAWKLHRMIEGSRLHFFERSGHFPFVEQPDLFVEVVERFLDGR